MRTSKAREFNRKEGAQETHEKTKTVVSRYMNRTVVSSQNFQGGQNAPKLKESYKTPSRKRVEVGLNTFPKNEWFSS